MAVQTETDLTNAGKPAVHPFRYSESVYFRDGQWLTGLLAAALYLILAAALDAAGHVGSLALVVPVTAGAFVLGVLMSYSRFDGFFALSHSMFVGLAWILFMMAGAVPANDIAPFLDTGVSELQARVYFVLLRLLDWVDAAFSGAASGDNYVFVFEISFLMWWLTYLGAWAIFRHGYTWRAIVPAGIVLLINTYFAPQPTTGFLIAFVIVALLLLVRTNLSEQQLRWREQNVYFNQDIVWDFLRNGLSFTVAIVVLAWILPGLGRNPQMREFLAPINQRWEDTAQGVQRLYQGLNRQEQAAGSSFGNSLSLGGERNVGDSLVFQAQALRARYWRAVVFDTFDGRQWTNTADTETNYDAGQIVPVASWRAREPISQTISLLSPVGDVLFGAADVAQASLRMRALVRSQAGATPIPAAQVAAGTLPVEFTLVRAGRDLAQGDSYAFVSAATNATIQDLEAAGASYPAEIVDKFVQIPPDFSPRVTELAQSLTANVSTPYAKAKAIEAYLRTIPYDDAIAAPPAGVDPLEYFLFDIQRGYCDYYATSMAMMLRVAGIPARTASGYAEGAFDEESQSYFITERDAHTWVEVFFPEYGWIEFEPTAGESPLDRPQSDADEMAVTSQQEEQQPESPLAPTPPAQGDPEDLPPQFTGEELLQPQSGLGGPPWWVWALALLLMVAVGAWLIWRARHNGPAAFSADLPLLLYERLQQWTQRLGLGPAPHETPYEHSRHVVAVLPDTQPYVAPLTEEYVRYRFAPTPVGAPSAGEDADLLQTWQTVEPIFWNAWLRSLRDRLLHRQGKDVYTLVDGDEKIRE